MIVSGALHAPLVQVSPVVHATQVEPAPALPQSDVVSLASATQVVPTQQPVQLAGPQLAVVTQTPPLQLWFVPQATQVAPGLAELPQSDVVSFEDKMQVVPAQHPWQLLALQDAPVVQTPPLQLWFVPQATQVAPAVAELPHSALVSVETVTQVVPWQQPKQFDALQVAVEAQTPPWQLWPVPHAVHAAPATALLPQSEDVSLAKGTQVP
jgi:hypothetical protein